MNKVAFYQKDPKKNQIELWNYKLKKCYKDFELVHLDDPRASEANIALLWKAPMNKVLELNKVYNFIGSRRRSHN